MMVTASHDAPALAGSAQPYTEVLPLHQRMRSQLSALRTHCQQAGIEPPVDQADVLTPAELLAVLQAVPAAGAADTVVSVAQLCHHLWPSDYTVSFMQRQHIGCVQGQRLSPQRPCEPH